MALRVGDRRRERGRRGEREGERRGVKGERAVGDKGGGGGWR